MNIDSSDGGEAEGGVKVDTWFLFYLVTIHGITIPSPMALPYHLLCGRRALPSISHAKELYWGGQI